MKGPHGKECEDFVLEQLPDEEIWADKVNWAKNFNDDGGSYVVKWKYMGDGSARAALRGRLAGRGEGAATARHYCSPWRHLQEITLSKKRRADQVRSVQIHAAVQGEYTLCVKGPGSKECHDFDIKQQQTDALVYSDRVSWDKNFPSTAFGPYIVKWKFPGLQAGQEASLRGRTARADPAPVPSVYIRGWGRRPLTLLLAITVAAVLSVR